MGTIYNIQRFSLHDGPGIRTTVFLKGCPLRCLWCHNPESQLVRPQLSLLADKCLGCGRCIDVCDVHSIVDGRHAIDYGRCVGCGRCADVCVAGALEIMGRGADAAEILDEVLRDSEFYRTSGGGMTVSGGEPTMQADFCAEILRGAHERGIHTALETCGQAPWHVFEKLLPHLDMALYDVKQMDPDLHRKYTGVDNRLILENLARLCAADQKIEVVARTPVIPGYNDQPENFRALADFLLVQPRRARVEILPYNPLAESKYQRIGKEYQPGRLDEKDGTAPDALCRILQEAGLQAAVVR